MGPNIQRLPSAHRTLTSRLSLPVLSSSAPPQPPDHLSPPKSHSAFQLTWLLLSPRSPSLSQTLLCPCLLFSLTVFSCPSQGGAWATSSVKPFWISPRHSDPAPPRSSFLVRRPHCLPRDCSCDTLTCEGLSCQFSYKCL